LLIPKDDALAASDFQVNGPKTLLLQQNQRLPTGAPLVITVNENALFEKNVNISMQIFSAAKLLLI
jgi:hypothetical protein